MTNIIDYELKTFLKVCIDELARYPEYSLSKPREYVKYNLRRVLRLRGKRDPFSWPNSMLAIGIEYAHKVDLNNSHLDALINYYKSWNKEGQRLTILDHAMNGYSLIYLYEQTNDEKIIIMINKIIDYLDKHKKDKMGSLPYRDTNNDIYIDSLGMICPFLSRYAHITGKREYGERAITQINNFYNFGFDKKSNLPYHGYNYDSKIKLGIIGWGRSIGWLMIGIVDSLEYLDSSYENYSKLITIYKSLAKIIIEYQKDNGAFSWQLQTIEGPNDSSSSSMVIYAIYKGILLNILDNQYLDNVDKGIKYLLNVNNNGYIMECSAECRGFGQYPQSYGWYPWSQGFTLALLSLRKQNQE